MKNLLLFTVLFLSGVTAHAQGLRLTLAEAVKNNMAAVTAVSTGKSYNDKGLTVRLENKTGSVLRVSMDMGALFYPSDSSYQPLLLAGEELLSVPAWKSYESEVQTFCANSSALMPSKGLIYTYTGTANDTLVSLLHYIKKNRLFDDLGQSAVWVFTNNDRLNNVYDPYRDRASKLLIDHIASISGRAKPEYYSISKASNVPGQPVYIPKTVKIIAEFEEKLAAPKTLTLGVFDAAGRMIQPVFENRTFGKAGHRFKVEFEASNASSGSYYIRLLEGSQVLQEKMVVVE